MHREERHSEQFIISHLAAKTLIPQAVTSNRPRSFRKNGKLAGGPERLFTVTEWRSSAHSLRDCQLDLRERASGKNWETIQGRNMQASANENPRVTRGQVRICGSRKQVHRLFVQSHANTDGLWLCRDLRTGRGVILDSDLLRTLPLVYHNSEIC